MSENKRKRKRFVKRQKSVVRAEGISNYYVTTIFILNNFAKKKYFQIRKPNQIRPRQARCQYYKTFYVRIS